MSDLHADDEALSAHLDGQGAVGPGGHEQEPWLRDHLDGCAACTARLTELQRARVALAAPVTPPPEWQRDAAISRALDAVGRPGARRRELGTWAGGIAAAILLVLGAAFGLSRLSHDGAHDTAALKQTSKAAGRARERAAATPPATVAASDLGDLGALGDTAALRTKVQATVAQLAARAPKAAAPAPEATRSGQFGSTDSTSAPRQCVDAARTLDPANVSPTAAGTATWRGTPAEVLVYAVAGRPGAARVYVLAQADCRVLEFQSYAP